MWWTRVLPPSIRSGSLWLYRAQPRWGSCSVRVRRAAEQPCGLYKGIINLFVCLCRTVSFRKVWRWSVLKWSKHDWLLLYVRLCSRSWKKFLTCLSIIKIKTTGRKSQGESSEKGPSEAWWSHISDHSVVFLGGGNYVGKLSVSGSGVE